MNKGVAVALGFALTFGLVGCQSGKEGKQESTVQVQDGSKEADLYKQKCSSCHGLNAEGGAGPALYDVNKRMSADEIENIIINGTNGMPSGLLVGDEPKQVAKWLSELK